MTTHPTVFTEPPDQFAQAVRVVVEHVIDDQQLEAVDPDTLPWEGKVLVIRSGSMPRLAAFLRQYSLREPRPDLHILSHARDEPTIRALAARPFTFHQYRGGGRYDLATMAEADVEALKNESFGLTVFLDNTMTGDRLANVERMALAVSAGVVCCFRMDDRLYSGDWSLHASATAAFASLLDWLHSHLGSQGQP